MQTDLEEKWEIEARVRRVIRKALAPTLRNLEAIGQNPHSEDILYEVEYIKLVLLWKENREENELTW
ncbi:MAG: hypothetical protein K0Q60_4576 [Microvirga sp.]|nr:hypothetical protein [Microvirga sp.]